MQVLAADGMDEQTPRAVLEGEGSYGARKAGLAVGETVILITPPCLSLLKHRIKVQGGCHQMTELSPTASQAGRHADMPLPLVGVSIVMERGCHQMTKLSPTVRLCARTSCRSCCRAR